MKFGEKNRMVEFFLGKLRVAYIKETISYGVEYVRPSCTPKSKKSEYYWLVYPFCDIPLQCTSFNSALSKLKSLCGEKSFNLLTIKEESDSKVEEIKISKV